MTTENETTSQETSAEGAAARGVESATSDQPNVEAAPASVPIGEPGEPAPAGEPAPGGYPAPGGDPVDPVPAGDPVPVGDPIPGGDPIPAGDPVDPVPVGDPAEPVPPGDPARGPLSAEASAEDVDDGSDEDGGEDEVGDGSPDAATTEGATPADGQKKKRRRRRRKKKPEGESAAAPAEGAPVEGGDGAVALSELPGEPGEVPRRERRRPDPRESMPFRIGEEVFGKVEKVTEDAIWIDVAGKALGLFDRRELGEGEPPQAGDQFIATVASHGLRGGMLRMSRAVFPIDDAREKVEKAKDSGDVIEGFVTGAVKGGVEVDLDGLRAFAPASHVEIRPGGDLTPLVGRRLNFIVVQYEKKGRDVVVSRKKFLHEEATQARADALKAVAPGSIHQGIVRTVMQWGVFVALPDAGNLEGLVHGTEAAHDRTAKLNDLFKPGDPIEVKVLKIDEKGKLWLSRRAMMNDPWDAMLAKYAVGTRHTGKVVRLQPFGAFIELEPGIDGLCYTQDLSLKPVVHPKDLLKVDDPMDVVVANCDGSTRRISLHPAPPPDEADEPKPRVGPHRVVKVAVVAPTEPGLLVRIIGLTGRAARGFIPAGHTGTERGTDLRKFFPIGKKFEAKVIEVDARRGETKLSIRAMREDAEKAAYNEYRVQVTKEAKFGTLGDLLGGKK